MYQQSLFWPLMACSIHTQCPFREIKYYLYSTKIPDTTWRLGDVLLQMPFLLRLAGLSCACFLYHTYVFYLRTSPVTTLIVSKSMLSMEINRCWSIWLLKLAFFRTRFYLNNCSCKIRTKKAWPTLIDWTLQHWKNPQNTLPTIILASHWRKNKRKTEISLFATLNQGWSQTDGSSSWL